MRMKFISSLLVALAAGFPWTGCSPKNDPKPNVDSSSHAAVAAANEGVPAATPTGSLVGGAADPKATLAAAGTSLPVVGPAPDWQLKDLDGNLVRSADFKGKVVVLDFWATWCPPCRAEIPGYVELYNKYGKERLAIVGVSLDDGPGVVRDFAKKFRINYPLVMGDQRTAEAFGATEAIPTTVLIDQEGRIRHRKVGMEPKEEYEKKIASLLN